MVSWKTEAFTVKAELFNGMFFPAGGIECLIENNSEIFTL